MARFLIASFAVLLVAFASSEAAVESASWGQIKASSFNDHAEPAGKLVISNEVRGSCEGCSFDTYWGPKAPRGTLLFAVYRDSVVQQQSFVSFTTPLYMVYIRRDEVGFRLGISSFRDKEFTVIGIPGVSDPIIVVIPMKFIMFDRWEGTIQVRPNGEYKAVAALFRLEVNREATPTSFTPGDASMDGEINSADAILVSRHVDGIEVLTSPGQIAAADMNGDGEVTQEDVVAILDWSASH